MSKPWETAAFLARSANRVAILQALDEKSRDRRELETETEASRSSLSRSLTEFEDRGWIRREGSTYTTTSSGSLVVKQFVSLLETIEGIQTLGDRLKYLPIEKMSLDIRHFNDARLVTPTEFDPTASFQYGINRMRESEIMRCVTTTVPPPYVRALYEDVTAGDLTAEIILDREYLDAVKGSEMAGLWRKIVANANIQEYEEDIPYRLIVLDEVVHLWLCSNEGEQNGLLESKNPAVREWAESLYEDHRTESEPLDTAMLSKA